MTKTPKMSNADDDDNKFFSTQTVEKDGIILTVKLLHLIKESQPRIFLQMILMI